VGPSFAGRPSDIFFTPATGAVVQTFSTAGQIGVTNPRDNVDAVDVELDQVEVFEQPPVEEDPVEPQPAVP